MNTIEMRSTTILTREAVKREPAWSWRSSWYSGSDSIYAVFAKFAALNRVKPRDICELFVEPNPSTARSRLVGQPIYPRVDLRYPIHVRYGRLANILKLDAQQLRQGFVSEQFPNAVPLASPNLAWCARCAQHGFHSASFQLNFFGQCPLHHEQLRRKCSHCRRPLPYSLYAPTSVGFFVCPHCHFDHAPKLRETRMNLALDSEAVSLFMDHVELVRFVDGLPTLVNAHKAAMGAPHLPIMISKADAFRRRVAFQQFVTDVLTSLSAQRKQEQRELHAQPPTARYVEPYLPVRLILKSVRGRHDPDALLREGWTVYRAIRRWLARRVLRRHMGCVAAAQKHLWWDLEGEVTKSFCPEALAFLRWRMQWEGCRVPASLDRAKEARPPYGLIAWVSAEAPVPCPLWTDGFSSWVFRHLLGYACLDSFRGCRSTRPVGRL